mmetsp:Transcript_56756/g.122663  ORF Transcript_56756/g.122663 Transcript_56756/m.122663 type:complete len:209 (-) Transcript_56756:1016-1642(-)
MVSQLADRGRLPLQQHREQMITRPTTQRAIPRAARNTASARITTFGSTALSCAQVSVRPARAANAMAINVTKMKSSPRRRYFLSGQHRLQIDRATSAKIKTTAKVTSITNGVSAASPSSAHAKTRPARAAAVAAVTMLTANMSTRYQQTTRRRLWSLATASCSALTWRVDRRSRMHSCQEDQARYLTSLSSRLFNKRRLFRLWWSAWW